MSATTIATAAAIMAASSGGASGGYVLSQWEAILLLSASVFGLCVSAYFAKKEWASVRGDRVLSLIYIGLGPLLGLILGFLVILFAGLIAMALGL